MPATQNAFPRPVLTVRVHAGLNAASLLAGLYAVSGMARLTPAAELFKLHFPQAQASLDIKPVSVNGISGVSAFFEAPAEGHVHRTAGGIIAYYEKEARLSDAAMNYACCIWRHLAAAEARVHGADVETVHFHEVGRMTNVYAIGLIAEIFAAMRPQQFVCSPLPLADGTVRCAHGAVPNPAPATLAQLEGVAVCAYSGAGETVTPTGLAVLKGLGAAFGAWPAMRISRQVTAFAPRKPFEGANGLVFAIGDPV